MVNCYIQTKQALPVSLWYSKFRCFGKNKSLKGLVWQSHPFFICHMESKQQHSSNTPQNPIHIPWTKLSSSAIKLTTCRSMCLATEGGTVLWGCTKSGPEGHWLTDHEAGPAGGHCYAARRMGNAAGRVTEWWCDVIIPSVVDGLEFALYASSCTVSSYRVQNKLCCFSYVITFKYTMNFTGDMRHDTLICLRLKGWEG